MTSKRCAKQAATRPIRLALTGPCRLQQPALPTLAATIAITFQRIEVMTPVPNALLQGASNFRDVGGYLTTNGQRVRRGQVFRSDHLAGLSDADVARLQALGVSHSLDFRGVAEYTVTPYDIPGVERVALTIEPTVIARMQALVAQGIVPTTEETVDLMRETYRDFVNRNADTYGRFLKHLLAQPTPQVFHCTAGKDRTGVVIAMGDRWKAVVDQVAAARKAHPAA